VFHWSAFPSCFNSENKTRLDHKTIWGELLHVNSAINTNKSYYNFIFIQITWQLLILSSIDHLISNREIHISLLIVRGILWNIVLWWFICMNDNFYFIFGFLDFQAKSGAASGKLYMAWENHLNADCAVVSCTEGRKKERAWGHVLTHGARKFEGRCKCLLCYWI
jgi:hypothetical protein